jgi:hypothetical protein
VSHLQHSPISIFTLFCILRTFWSQSVTLFHSVTHVISVTLCHSVKHVMGVSFCHSVTHVMGITFVTCVTLVTNIFVMCHWSSNVSYEAF